MILMILVIISLIFWFFFAKVTLYARSSAIRLTDNGRLLVTFPKETIGQIKPGQAAMLRLRSDSNGKIVGIPAIVFSIDTQNHLVEAVLLSENIPTEISPGDLQGEVSIEVANVTPVSLVVQAIGNGTAQQEVPVSPQLNEERNP
jgi:hypothetical protein